MWLSSILPDNTGISDTIPKLFLCLYACNFQIFSFRFGRIEFSSPINLVYLGLWCVSNLWLPLRNFPVSKMAVKINFGNIVWKKENNITFENIK